MIAPIATAKALHQLFPLIPLEPHGKRPVLNAWQDPRARDGYPIDRHRGNIGGVIGPNYLIVDIDPRSGGGESFIQLKEDHPEFDFMFDASVLTAGGGAHIYLKLPENHGAKIRQAHRGYPGIDWLTGNHYIVLPGSVNGVGSWRWYKEPVLSPPEIPAYLLNSLFPEAPVNHKDEKADHGEFWGVLTCGDLEKLLSGINPEHYQNHDDWLQLMLMSHHATGGEGLAEFEEWSTADDAYADAGREIEYRWNSLTARGGGDRPVTARSFGHALGGMPHWLTVKLGMAQEIKSFAPVDNGQQELRDAVRGYTEGIEATTDAIILSTELWPRIASDSTLTDAMRGLLGKKLAKQSKIPYSDLKKSLPRLSKVKREHDPDNPDDTDDHQSHIKIAEAVLSHMGGSHKVVYQNGSFWSFDKTHWQRVDDHNIRHLIQRIAKRPEYDVLVTGGAISSVYGVLQTLMPLREQDFFNPDSGREIRINSISGVLTLKDGQWLLSEHAPEHRMNYVVPVKFDPTAQCPEYDSFIDRAVDSDAPTKRSLLTFIIYSMISRRPWLRKSVLLHGPTASGKSVFLDLLNAMMGRRNCSSIPLEDFESDYSLESLDGKLVNIAGEIDSGRKSTAKKFKMLVSGDPIEINRKYKSYMTLNNTATLWFAGNHYPSIQDSSSATRNRVSIVSFPNSMEEEDWDHMIGHKLVQEMDGVFMQALQVFADEYQNDECTGITITQERSAHKMLEWEKQQQPLAAWVEDRIDETDNEHDFVTSKVLYADYTYWARETGHNPMNATRFARHLKEMLRQEYSRSREGRGYKGIQLYPAGGFDAM